MNKLKKNNLEDVLQEHHYTTTIKKWKSLLGNTTVDIENHKNVEDISKKLKLNIQLFYPRTNAIIGGSNHHKQSYKRAQLLKVKKNVYKPIVYGGDKGFGTLGLFKSKEKSKNESILFDLNDETYNVNDWNTLLKEPFPNDAFIVYQKNEANLQKDIKNQCTNILETDKVTKLTNLPIDGIDYAPIGFITIEAQQNEYKYKYIGQYAYYINTNGQKVCFNLSVIDQLPKDNGVFKCPYTKNNLITFKDILLRFRKQIKETTSTVLGKIDDHLKNVYGWEHVSLIDLDVNNKGEYIIRSHEDIKRNLNALKQHDDEKFGLIFEDFNLLPPEIGELTNLVHLYLNNNELTSLPDEIGQLSSLKELNISGNQLTSLPDKIGQLSSLKELNISDNQLTSLPPTIGQLTNLNSLDLNGNQLTSLPDEIGQLTNLNSLYLNDNQLTSLPPTIGQLTNLVHLYLNENSLTQLPESLINIIKSDKLLTINVQDLEQLEQIPPELKDAFIELMQNTPTVLISDNEFNELLMVV